MPEEPNGNRDTRLDRIEHALELMISDHERFREQHEQFRVDLQQLLTAQVVQNENHSRQIAAESKERQAKDAALDARVDKLVSAIGEFISRLPPQQ